MSETGKPVALITGGGRGMGEAIARELASNSQNIRVGGGVTRHV